jgi:hypothetical protein
MVVATRSADLRHEDQTGGTAFSEWKGEGVGQDESLGRRRRSEFGDWRRVAEEFTTQGSSSARTIASPFWRYVTPGP